MNYYLYTKTAIIIVFREYRQYFTLLYNFRYPVYIIFRIAQSLACSVLAFLYTVTETYYSCIAVCMAPYAYNYNIVLEIKITPFMVIRVFRFHNDTILRSEYVAT